MMLWHLDARLTTNQAAALINVRPATIRKWAHRHLLTAAGRDRRGRPLYRAGDILETDHATRHGQATRRNRTLTTNQ